MKNFFTAFSDNRSSLFIQASTSRFLTSDSWLVLHDVGQEDSDVGDHGVNEEHGIEMLPAPTLLVLEGGVLLCFFTQCIASKPERLHKLVDIRSRTESEDLLSQWKNLSSVFLSTNLVVRSHSCVPSHIEAHENTCCVSDRPLKDGILSLITARYVPASPCTVETACLRCSIALMAVSVTLVAESASLVLQDDILLPLSSSNCSTPPTPSHAPTWLLLRQREACPSSWSWVPSSRGWLQKKCLFLRRSTLSVESLHLPFIHNQTEVERQLHQFATVLDVVNHFLGIRHTS